MIRTLSKEDLLKLGGVIKKAEQEGIEDRMSTVQFLLNHYIDTVDLENTSPSFLKDTVHTATSILEGYSKLNVIVHNGKGK